MILARLASLRFTLAALGALAIGAAAHLVAAEPGAAWLVAPLAALAANLAAAIAVNRAFRADPPLLVFHVALLALVAIAAVGRLTAFTGQAEVAVGEAFDGHVNVVYAGPLHAGRLRDLRFVNEGFSIRYARGMKRAETRNAVRVLQADGAASRHVIGDTVPLVLDGYRFYTSFNKGFSLVFRWQPGPGAIPERGTVNLPAFPAHEHGQALEWDLPGAGRVWTMLEMDRSPLDAARESEFRPPEAHRVVLRAGAARWELQPGEQARLPAGVLAYEGLGTWMGYTVTYDPTLPWLFAAVAIAVAALGWHLARRFRAAPWDA